MIMRTLPSSINIGKEWVAWWQHGDSVKLSVVWQILISSTQSAQVAPQPSDRVFHRGHSPHHTDSVGERASEAWEFKAIIMLDTCL